MGRKHCRNQTSPVMRTRVWPGDRRRVRVGKTSFTFCSIGRPRLTWPLAIMPYPDQVPIKLPHLTMLRHKWVVVIAGLTGSGLRAVRSPNLRITPVAQELSPNFGDGRG